METQKKNHTQISHELIAKHQVLRDLIGTSPFYYVDVPLHANIGDLLIMQGTLAFFKKINVTPRLSAPYFSFRDEWVRPGDTIVCHGGGNFGDLYPPLQEFRERLAVAKPGNRIIITPQSIHFTSDLALKKSAQLFRTHPDLHLCVRDAVSYDLAKQFTDKVYLMPDMAHQLFPITANSTIAANGVLQISRVDDEKIDDHNRAQFSARTRTDWPVVVGNHELIISLFRKVSNRLGKLRLGFLANTIIMPIWVAYSKMLTNDAIKLFAGHEEIVSDRLHGHILAVLMSKPNTVLDNSYGKNSRYANEWTAASELVTLTPSVPSHSDSSPEGNLA